MIDGDTDKHDEQHYHVAQERMQDGVWGSADQRTTELSLISSVP